MTAHTIALADELEQLAVRQAALRNESVDEYLNSLVAESLLSPDSVSVEPGTLSGAEMIEHWTRVGAFSDEPLNTDSVDIVRQLRDQGKDRWKS